MTNDQFAAVQNAIKDYEAKIHEEWKRAQPVLDDYVSRGAYEAEREYRYQVSRIVEGLRLEIYYLKLRMPPFLTFEDGFYHQNPVTPENEHLLRC